MDAITKDKIIKLRALIETKVSIAENEKNDYSAVRIVSYGLDNIFTLLNIEIPNDDKHGNLKCKLVAEYEKDCKKDIGFLPKEFDDDLFI